jgi:hypothetical protein
MANLWLTNADTVEPAGEFTTEAVASASLILHKLSGERYSGVNTVTEVYGTGHYATYNIQPVVIDGQIRHLPLSTGQRELRLRHAPVRSVESIKLNGVVMDPSMYSLRNNAYIVREHSVPWVVDVLWELEVSYTYGVPIPAAGRNAAIRLANELIWAKTNSRECTLPERVTSITRQGESLTMLDPLNFLKEGRTGVYEIDLFLSVINPNKAKKKSKVFSVDKPRGEKIN